MDGGKKSQKNNMSTCSKTLPLNLFQNTPYLGFNEKFPKGVHFGRISPWGFFETQKIKPPINKSPKLEPSAGYVNLPEINPQMKPPMRF